MSEKMLIIVISGEKDKTKAIMGLNLANHLNDETKVILFGESEKLVASDDKDIKELIKNLQEKGIIPIACSGYAEKNNIDGKLKELKLEIKPISTVISDYVNKGYIPLTF
ncbi:hypothetical protein [Ferroplasma sp.]|uniref:hypothetical protein n=1 Tax=Ferroplasma sp. TaxID=2591003 RepID=UPI00307EB866